MCRPRGKKKKERRKEGRKRERVIEFDASQRYRSVAEIFLHKRENYFESKVKRRGWRIFFFFFFGGETIGSNGILNSVSVISSNFEVRIKILTSY